MDFRYLGNSGLKISEITYGNCQERDDRRAALDELGPVAPLRVQRVCRGDPLRVTAVPGVLGRLHLDPCGRFVERWHGWARGHRCPTWRWRRGVLVGHAGQAATKGKSISTAAAVLK